MVKWVYMHRLAGPALSQLGPAPNSTDLGASSLTTWADRNCSELALAPPKAGLAYQHGRNSSPEV